MVAMVAMDIVVIKDRVIACAITGPKGMSTVLRSTQLRGDYWVDMRSRISLNVQLRTTW